MKTLSTRLQAAHSLRQVAKTGVPLRFFDKLPWPAPALLAWALAWGLVLLAGQAGWPLWLGALAGGLPLAVLLGMRNPTAMRRMVVIGGYVVSVAASGVAAGLPPWAWLLLGALVLLLYPLRAWQAAPLFPTPLHALEELPRFIPAQPGMTIIDAGSGSGEGLRALRRVYPHACLLGLEWSPLLVLWSRLRCPWAEIRHADLWRYPWNSASVVYLFQRADIMEAAYNKALQEMDAGSWLVSLEFRVPGVEAEHRIELNPERSVWLYRMPGPGA